MLTSPPPYPVIILVDREGLIRAANELMILNVRRNLLVNPLPEMPMKAISNVNRWSRPLLARRHLPPVAASSMPALHDAVVARVL